MAQLIVQTPDGRRSTHELTVRPLKLGRADTCDIVLRDDAEVSREHAEIWLEHDGRVKVTDRGSKNGTRVDDGEPFRNATRTARRTVRIGEHAIEIVGGEAAGPSGSRSSVVFTADAPTTIGDTQFFPSTRRIDLSQQRLALLIALTDRIGGVFERKQLLEQALEACCDALGFERGLIALKTPRGETELPVTRNVQRDETGAFKISRTLINRALVHGERAIVNNPATDLVGNLSESLVRFPICSALCVPILYQGEILGVMYGDRITQASTYQPEDVDFFAAIAQQVGVGLANLRLLQEHLKSQKLYAELEQARTIQRRLLPSAPLQLGRVRIEGYNEPSSAVGGDYYDYFELEDGKVGLIIADVTGHGLAAALVMANLQSVVRVALTAEAELTELAARLNRLICQNTAPNVFITALLGKLDPASAAIDLVSAGHPLPIVVGAPATDLSDRNALPLGIDPDEKYEAVSLVLPGSARGVLLYTDGLIEASSPSGQILGVEAVESALTGLTPFSTREVIRAARGAVRKHLDGQPNTDDMTLLAVQLNA